MSKLVIHAGDFRKGKATLSVNDVIMSVHHAVDTAQDGWLAITGKHEALSWRDIEEITEASEENVKRLGGTVGWGIVGATLLGPVGLLAGLLMGGKGKDVTFVLKMKDGRKMLATTDSKTYTKMIAKKF